MTTEIPPLSPSPTPEAEIDSLRQAVSQKTQPRLLSLKKCLGYLSILLVIVSIALLAFVVRQQHHQLVEFQSLMRNGSFQHLPDEVQRLHERLDKADTGFVSRQDWQMQNGRFHQALIAQQGSVNDQQKPLVQSVTDLSRAHQDLTETVNVLKNTVKQQEMRVDALIAWKSQQEKHFGKKAGTPDREVLRTKKRIVAPFILSGIERRGEQVYAVIIPRDTDPHSQLSQMRLLSLGESAKGWTWVRIDGQQAVFQVQGQHQTLLVSRG
ncbi:hypothetical protein [Photorhabdus heterorhabditis]|uniref:hypothetical protein n=1 Tax=Photorhabdus heterorhabditis TaxID=880156 RepID=UPI0015625BDD|nr:hypothetical protein [Photorhabdus heterorhabditis]NRN30816.1 hypothetical protein [Photorhabdus heterorhabditis subsp. aluminescens]